MIKLVVTSAIRIYREGLGHIVGEPLDIDVIGLANDKSSTIQLVSHYRPEVLLLDVTMHDSFSLAKQVAILNPSTKIVALSVADDESHILNCAEVGVQCYVPFEASKDDIIDAVREASKGQCYCPPNIAAYLLRKVQNAFAVGRKHNQHNEYESAIVNPVINTHTEETLTRRERQIGKLLAKGLSNKQIALDLCIEVSTVKNHVHNLLVKLKVKNRCQAVLHLQHEFSTSSSSTLTRSLDLDPSNYSSV